MQKGQKELALKGRNLISDSRFVGCINEWHGSWGWIEPLDVVSHPQIRKNRGRVYVHRTDARHYIKMEVGTHLDFQIFCDARGLGAVDCTQVNAGALEAAAAVAEEAGSDKVALPEGWEKHWSAEQSEYFYWNRLTKETSWLPPTPASEEDDENELPLPHGWSKHFDAEDRQWYYWNKVTKKASWDRPTQPAQKTQKERKDELGDEERPAKKAKLSKENAPADAPVLGQQRVQGRVVEWHGFYGSILPLEELSDDLKPLLAKGEDKIYLNWRDVQPGLEVEALMEVDFMLYEDDNGLAASDVRLPGAKSAVGKQSGAVAERLAQEWAEEDEAEAGDAAEAAAAAEQGDDDENEGPLLPGWEQMWSDEHETHYYWHKATKVSSWERPSLPVDDDDDEEEEPDVAESKVWEGEGSQAGASQMATPMTPLVSQKGRAMTPVTPGAAKARSVDHAVLPKLSKPQRNVPTGIGGSGFGARPGLPKPFQPKQMSRRYLQSWER